MFAIQKCAARASALTTDITVDRSPLFILSAPIYLVNHVSRSHAQILQPNIIPGKFYLPGMVLFISCWPSDDEPHKLWSGSFIMNYVIHRMLHRTSKQLRLRPPGTIVIPKG